MTVRWGLLSTARINDAFIAGVGRSELVQIAAVASRDGDRARVYARQRGIPRAYDSYEALLADPEIDAVYVSLPNGLHLEWSQRALRAGKHVLCEKPLGPDPEQVAAAFDVAEQCGRVLSEAFMFRHHPQTLMLARLVRQGAIGQLRTIRSHFSFRLADPGDIRASPELQGGALLDLGCYCVSAARLLAGEPVAAAGVQLRRGGVDWTFAGTLRFAGDVVAALDCSFESAPGYGLEVMGSDGRLVVRDPWHIFAPGIELTDADGTREVAVDAADSYQAEAEDLARVLDGDGLPRLGRQDAVGQARAIAMLYAAAADGGQAVQRN